MKIDPNITGDTPLKKCACCFRSKEPKEKNDLCKECRSIRRHKWWKKNWPWVACVAVAAIAIGVKVCSAFSETTDDASLALDDGVDSIAPIIPTHQVGSKYWNPEKRRWEKDGIPYIYRVSYKDTRDGKIHIRDYTDIDNGYEDCQYYEKQWFASDVTWDHVFTGESDID